MFDGPLVTYSQYSPAVTECAFLLLCLGLTVGAY